MILELSNSKNTRMENILNDASYDYCRQSIQKYMRYEWIPVETKELMAKYYNSLTVDNAGETARNLNNLIEQVYCEVQRQNDASTFKFMAGVACVGGTLSLGGYVWRKYKDKTCGDYVMFAGGVCLFMGGWGMLISGLGVRF